jgi:AraC-like DNA-binding protein
MSESAALVSALVHGVAVGAVIVMTLTVWLSGLGRQVRAATAMLGVSVVCWLVTESPELCLALGDPWPMYLLSYPAAGFFWLFVLVMFAEVRITPLTLAPALILGASGVWMRLAPSPTSDWIWWTRNLASAALAVHAATVVLRGWRDDLVEGRRRLRALLISLTCLFVIIEVGAGFADRLDPRGPWLMVVVGRPYGGLIMAVLGTALALMALQARPAVFGAARRAEPASDPRAETAERQLLERLNALMAAEAWRREGLAIGDLARELDTPEHRLRRLINQRLGHRNFADFLNGHRIDAAKRRLSDPAEARTTVAAIAFDLGYGSLGPFNRAFRAATGATPTEWRRRALATSPELQEAV